MGATVSEGSNIQRAAKQDYGNVKECRMTRGLVQEEDRGTGRRCGMEGRVR